MTLIPDDELRLELTAPHHAPALLQLVNDNREHLQRFLPWVPLMQTEADFLKYIEKCRQLYEQGSEVSFVIYYKNEAAGRIGIHYINPANKSGAIGYWLSAHAEGKGIITRSCIALINYGFSQLQLHRIEIKAATENRKSQAIPEKLGFVQEGILRQAEWVHDRFHDLKLYSLLKEDWNK